MERTAAPYGLLVLMVVTGALLAFSLEPLTGRMATPFFGGAIHVWTVSVMVFQGLLFAAYLYAHLVARYIGAAHLLIVLLPLGFLPLHMTATAHPEAPIGPLVWDLLAAIGVPFFTLATTSVVAQYWLARSDVGRTREPWGLYAASNVGSLAALCAYPLLVEPFLGVEAQSAVWTWGYLGYCAITVATWRALRPHRQPEIPITEDAVEPTPKRVGQWLLLSMVPSMLLLGVTNVITSELGSFPLFWVFPLALYLGSFVLAFRAHDKPSLFLEFWPDLTLFLALLCQFVILAEMQPLLYAVFFVLCWIVHEQLYLTRPSPRYLTAFYLAIALGGWLGGIAVSVLAPLIFDSLVELPLSLVGIAIALLWVVGPPKAAWWKRVHIRFSGSRAILTGTITVLLGLLLFGEASKDVVDRERSLYGIFTVTDLTTDDGIPYRELASGATSHGKQYLAGPEAKVPMSYYHPAGPNHRALDLRMSKKPARMAGIGLGAGAVAAMLGPGESLVFYELSPTSVRMAQEWFTYLEDSRGTVEIRLGDARLKMASEADQTPYDAIFLDAFSGDGIPTHLLTREAIQTYLDRLAPEGLLVLHISNRYYDLRGVLATAAKAHGLASAGYLADPDDSESDDPLFDSATTVVLSRDPARLHPLLDAGWTALDRDPTVTPATEWTDDYIDILEPLQAQRARLSAK